MELHHRSSVVPSNAPVLPDPDSSIPRRVLREQSGNRRHEYQDSSSSSWKREASPTENVHLHGSGGSYFSSNITSQLSGEKSEAQIENETKRLLSLLERCEKYQKYRDRQTLNAKEKEQQWSDTLERAFFRGILPSTHSSSVGPRTHSLRPSTMAAHGSSKAYARWTTSRSKRIGCRLDIKRHRGNSDAEAGIESYTGSQEHLI